MNKGATLHAFRIAPLVLPRGHRYFILWLACGHSGGVAKSGDAVNRRRCHSCGGGYKQVVKAEPRE